jgi:hypothetical protein
MANGDQQQIAKLLRLNGLGHILERATLRELNGPADHPRWFVEDNGNPASLGVELPQNLGGSASRDGQMNQNRANAMRFE